MMATIFWLESLIDTVAINYAETEIRDACGSLRSSYAESLFSDAASIATANDSVPPVRDRDQIQVDH